MQDDVGSTSSASNRPGRADETLFAEALQAVTDLQSLTAEGGSAASAITDAVEETLIEEIETASGDFGHPDHYVPPVINADATADLEAARPGTQPAPLLRQSSVGIDNQVPLLCDDAEQFTNSLDWSRLLRALLPRTSLLSELRLLLGALAPLWCTTLMDTAGSRIVPLLVRLVYMFAGARLLAIVYQAVGVFALLHLPVFEWKSLVLKGSFGWASTTALVAVLCSCLSMSGVDATAWADLSAQTHFVPTCYWMLCTAVSKPLVEAWVQLYLNSLRLYHYEHRAQEAHSAQTALRVLVSAARAAIRSRKSGPTATKIRSTCLSKSADDLPTAVSIGSMSGTTTTAPALPLSRPVEAESGSGWSHFFSVLDDLAGPLEFGAEFDDASSLTQARKRALKVFRILSTQAELQGASSSTGTGAGTGDGGAGAAPASVAGAGVLDRAVLIRWASRRVCVPITEAGVTALFKTTDPIDEDGFVACVERCYKEQRMITASVASFDRTNALFHRACMSVWAGCVVFALLLVWGVSLTSIIIPFFTVLGTLILIMGRAPGELVSGALYSLFLRPFDIGDRITISKPGEKAVLYSLLVREIGIARTHFLTVNGELLHIENHVLRDMSMVNLSRSGPLTLLVEIKVSITTPASKMTELVDSIKLFAAEKESDWTAIDAIFSDTNFDAGYLSLSIWASSKHAAAEVGLVNSAKSLLILFIHAYMQSANIESVQPLVPVKLSNGVPSSLKEVLSAS